MLSSTTSFTSFFKSKASVALVYLFCALTTDQTSIQFPNPVPKNTFIFNPKTKGYTKNTTEFERIDFRDGEWYFIKDLMILEFHSRIPGFLDFSDSSRSFYKALYLNDFERVLVFPQELNGSPTRIPYVDRANAFEESFEVVKIYPQGPRKLRECFSDPETLELVFPAEQRAEIVAQWNRMPFLDPQIKGKGTFNSFNNHWGSFFGFGEMIVEAMKTPQTGDTEKNAENQVKRYFMSNLLRRSLFIIFDSKMEFVNYPYHEITSQEKIDKYMNLNNLAQFIESKFLESAGTKSQFRDFKSNIYVILRTLCEEMVNLFMSQNATQYLEYLMLETEDYSTFLPWFNVWKKERMEFPIGDQYLTWNDSIAEFIEEKLNTIGENNRDPYQKSYAELSKLKLKAQTRFETLFKEFFEFVLDSLAEGLDEKSRTEIKAYMAQKNADIKPILDKIVKNAKQAKEAHLKSLNQADPKKIFNNFVDYEGVNISMHYAEYRVFNDFLPKWDVWAALEMPIFESTPNNYIAWLEKLLAMVGEIPRDFAHKPNLFELMGIEIFKIANRRVMI